MVQVKKQRQRELERDRTRKIQALSVHCIASCGRHRPSGDAEVRGVMYLEWGIWEASLTW